MMYPIYSFQEDSYATKYDEWQRSIIDQFENISKDYIQFEISASTTVKDIIDHLVKTCDTDQIVFYIRKHCTTEYEQRHAQKYGIDYIFQLDDFDKPILSFPILKSLSTEVDITKNIIVLGYYITDVYEDMNIDEEPEEPFNVYNCSLYNDEYNWLIPENTIWVECHRLDKLIKDSCEGSGFYLIYPYVPERLMKFEIDDEDYEYNDYLAMEQAETAEYMNDLGY